MANTFKGFPKETFTFLEELAGNNNRDWFSANKERYKTDIVVPVMEFINAIRPGLTKISRYYVADSRPHGGSMFRIYKDTRFSKDKRPYKEHVGCQFRHAAGKDAHAPGFYVHLSPHEVFFGAGIWCPPNPILDQIRTAIVEKPGKWDKVINNKAIKTHFGGIRGDGLKRPPRGYPADHPYLEDLKRKSFLAMHEVDPALVTTPRFISEVENSFSTASPLVTFITNAMGLSF